MLQRCFAHCRPVAAPQVLNNEIDKEISNLSVQSHRYLVQTLAAQVEQQISNSEMQLTPSGPLHTAWHIVLCFTQSCVMQTYNSQQMRHRILNACSHDSSINQRPADALLLLSGSHPLRNLPWADRQDTLPVTSHLLCCVLQSLDPAVHSAT